MKLETLLERLPDFANDLRLNLTALLDQTEISAQQLWGTAVASAAAAKSSALLNTVIEEAGDRLSPQAVTAAKTAAAIMGMNNVYFRFLHLSGNPKYRTIPARLRMNAMRTHGIERADFELWCIAVSAINACEDCIRAHEKAAKEAGLSEEQILAAIRLAAVVSAIAAVMASEAL